MISRQAAIDAVNELTRWYYETYHEKRPTAIAVIDKLMDLPFVESEIIYCKYCEYWDEGKCNYFSVDEKNVEIHTDSDGFCSEAERRADEK